LYTSNLSDTNSILSVVYGSNFYTIPSSNMNQGGHKILGQYSSFSSISMFSIGLSGFQLNVSRVSPGGFFSIISYSLYGNGDPDSLSKKVEE